MRYILILLLLLASCEPPMQVSETVEVVITYGYNPLPLGYGDTIEVYKNNLDPTDKYELLSIIPRYAWDTITIQRGTRLVARYTYNNESKYEYKSFDSSCTWFIKYK